jgi:predicted cupin superfamily sugar epimerase
MESMNKAQNLITHYNMQPHPEGGFYKETYRSQHSTGIYYLLGKGDKSSLHRIKSDELWHFYEGDSLIVVELTQDGGFKETRLGRNLEKGEIFQYVVPGGVWFGAYLPDDSQYALVGCTVSPAFEYKDFEMGNKAELLKNYPQAVSVINKLLS